MGWRSLFVARESLRLSSAVVVSGVLTRSIEPGNDSWAFWGPGRGLGRLPVKQGLMVGPWLLPCWSPSAFSSAAIGRITPIARKGVRWEGWGSLLSDGPVGSSRLSQQRCSKSSSTAIISSTIPGDFLFCSSARLHFSLLFVKIYQPLAACPI